MIYYENNNGTRMDLDNWPVVIKDITELYGKEWKYSATENVNANRKKLDKFYRTGMSKKITLQVYADTKEEYCDVMDQLNEITDIDIIEKKPGKLWVGDYYLECYITELNPKEYDEIFYTVDVDATVEAFTSYWIGKKHIHFTAMESRLVIINGIRENIRIDTQTEWRATTLLIRIIHHQIFK